MGWSPTDNVNSPAGGQGARIIDPFEKAKISSATDKLCMKFGRASQLVWNPS